MALQPFPAWVPAPFRKAQGLLPGLESRGPGRQIPCTRHGPPVRTVLPPDFDKLPRAGAPGRGPMYVRRNMSVSAVPG